MPATFSVPARRLRSCRPPVMKGTSRTPRRIQRAPVALRAVELVRGQRQQIDAERPHIQRHLPGGLHRIGVHEGATRVRGRGDGRDGLHGADLVVGVHHRHQCRVIGQRVGHCLHRDDAGPIDRDEGDAPAAPGERAHRVQDGLVLDGGRDQVPATARLERLGGAANGGVVAFGPTAREHHLGGVRADQVCHLGAGIVDDRLGLLAEVVDTGGVAPDVPGDAR